MLCFSHSSSFSSYIENSHIRTMTNCNFFWLAHPAKVDAEPASILNVLTNIVRHCINCQHFCPAPVRFKAMVPSDNNLVFGDRISVDLMFLNGMAELHVVDTATRFSAATFQDAHGSSHVQSSEVYWLNWWNIVVPFIPYIHIVSDPMKVPYSHPRSEKSCPIVLQLRSVFLWFAPIPHLVLEEEYVNSYAKCSITWT